MSIKILNSLKDLSENRNDVIVIGTHNGIFHSDEVLACAILCLIHNNCNINILRSRNLSELKNCDICIDIGGGQYDHHQPGFSERRPTGEKYASAGLIWKDYGNQLISILFKGAFDNKYNTNHLYKEFDINFIVPVDNEDNGIKS